MKMLTRWAALGLSAAMLCAAPALAESATGKTIATPAGFVPSFAIYCDDGSGKAALCTFGGDPGSSGTVQIGNGGVFGSTGDSAYTGSGSTTAMSIFKSIDASLRTLSNAAQDTTPAHVVVDTLPGSPMQQTGGTVGITGPVPLPTNASTEATLASVAGKLDVVAAKQDALAAQLSGPDGPHRMPNPMPVLPDGFQEGRSVAEPPTTGLTAPGIITVASNLTGVGHICWAPTSPGSGNTVVVEQLAPDRVTWNQIPVLQVDGTTQPTLITRTSVGSGTVLCSNVSGIQQRIRLSAYGSGSVSFVGLGYRGPITILPAQLTTKGQRMADATDTVLEDEANNISTGTILTLTAASANAASTDQVNRSGHGVVCTLNATAITGSPSFYLFVESKALGSYFKLAQEAAQTATGLTTLIVYPGASAGGTTNVSSVVPRNWRLSVAISGGTVTGTAECQVLQ